MSLELETLVKELRGVRSRLDRIEQYMRKQEVEGTWLTPEEAEKLTGLSPQSLRKKFAAGIIEKRRTTNGRKPKYLKEELEEKFLKQ